MRASVMLDRTMKPSLRRLFRRGKVGELQGGLSRRSLHDAAIEAGSRTGVTGNSIALNIRRKPHDILIAIGPDVRDLKKIAALFALLPECAARAAPEMGDPTGDRLVKSLFVHVSKHEDIAGASIRDDRGDKSVRTKTVRSCGWFRSFQS